MAIDRKLPKELLKAVIKAAELNLKNNKDKLKGLSIEDLYKLAFTQGYETAWSIYCDELEEEVFNAYDE